MSVFSDVAYQSQISGSLNQRSKNVDIRPWHIKALDYLPIVSPYLVALIGLIILFCPSVSFLFFIVILLSLYSLLSRQIDYLCNIPYGEKGNKPFSKSGDALMLYGYDMVFGSQLWANIDRETRMALVTGTTGSGKTVFVSGQLAQAAVQAHLRGGAPTVMVDGKGTVKGLMEWMFIMIRCGLIDNIRICNFLTGGVRQNPDAMKDEHYTSNRFNLFSVLNDEECRSVIMSFGRSSEGGNSEFFKDRASTMLGGVFKPLCYKRDELGEPLDVRVIRRFTELREMLSLASSDELPNDVLSPLREYLKSLNGIEDHMFSGNIDWATQEINTKAEEQHTYNRSMLTKTLNEMAESLGHIFCSTGSEFNFRTAFQHGQNLFALLPTIDRDVDSMQELGRMLVGGLRPAFSPLMGFSTQGNYKKIVGGLASESRVVPLRIWLDEVLNYYVKGISGFLSLLRSTTISITLMGQSLKGLEDTGISEARQSEANLNNVIMFSNQDVFESAEFLEKKMGKQQVHRIREMNHKNWGLYHSSNRVDVTEEAAITAKDLASADGGEGLYIYRGHAIPFRSTFLCQSKREKQQLQNMDFYLNILAPLLPPPAADVEQRIFKNHAQDEALSGTFRTPEEVEEDNSDIIKNLVSNLAKFYEQQDHRKTLKTNDMTKSVQNALVADFAALKLAEYAEAERKALEASKTQRAAHSVIVEQTKASMAKDEIAEVTVDRNGAVIEASQPIAEATTAMPDGVQEEQVEIPESYTPTSVHERQMAKLGIGNLGMPKPSSTTNHKDVASKSQPKANMSDEEKSNHGEETPSLQNVVTSKASTSDVTRRLISGEQRAKVIAQLNALNSSSGSNTNVVATAESEGNESDGDVEAASDSNTSEETENATGSNTSDTEASKAEGNTSSSSTPPAELTLNTDNPQIAAILDEFAAICDKAPDDIQVLGLEMMRDKLAAGYPEEPVPPAKTEEQHKENAFSVQSMLDEFGV